MAFAFAYQNGSGGGGVADNIYTADGTLEADRTATMGGFFLKFQDSSISLEMGEGFASGDPGGFIGLFPSWPDYNLDGTEYGLFISPVYYGEVAMVNGLSYVSCYGGSSFIGADSVDGKSASIGASSGQPNSFITVSNSNASDGSYSSTVSLVAEEVSGLSDRLNIRAAHNDLLSNNVWDARLQFFADSSTLEMLYIFSLSDSVGSLCKLYFDHNANTVIDGNNRGGDAVILGFENIAINANDTISIQAVNNIDLGCNYLTFGLASTDLFQIQADTILFNGGSNFLKAGTGSPEGVVTANVGSLYVRENGGASTTLYVKESGTGNTGWVAK